ncbi:MAG: bacteriohemerythrin [Bacteroidales bacterium]
MIFFEWDNRFVSGNKIIDDDHKKLVGLINELYTEMSSGDGENVVGNIINQLSNYAETHFKNEELLMKKFDYPEYYKHKAQHDTFAKKVASFAKKSKKDSISIEVASFLKEWMTKHILLDDKKVIDYMDNRTVSI